MHGSDELCDVPALKWGKVAYKYHGMHLGSGNRCGHNPAQLATGLLKLPEVKGGYRPALIEKLKKCADAYFADPASVPLLAYLSGVFNRDGTPRQNRSEGREAQSLILQAAFDAMDLKSLRVGTYTPTGDFNSLSFQDLAHRCGLVREYKSPETGETSMKPCSRFWRGVSWLKKAGAWTVHEQYVETPEGPRAVTAIKHFNAKFLRVLGRITKQGLKNATQKASAKVAKYLATATHAGIQSTETREKLEAELRSERVHKELFPKPAIKNQMPKGVARDNSDAALVDDYTAYVQAKTKEIVEQHGITVAQASRMFAKYGGLSSDNWKRLRLKQ